MLAETWEAGRYNPELRKNLFHGLSRTILTMARIPLPKIGSFTLDKSGYLSLSNRPLTLDIQQLENEHIPVDVPRSVTHASIDSYLSDIMHVHENRIRHQPNAVNSIEDGFYQTAALMVMRSILPLFFRRLLSRGPFFLTLTNMDQTNILVDENWNIKYLIDLEWACSKPVEMIHPPYWLTNDAIDSVNAEEYSVLHTEFMEAFAEEELQITTPISLHSILQQGWERGTFWCSLALQSPSSLFTIFYDYIQPRFSNACDDPSFWVVTMPYWAFNTYDFIEQKVKDKEQYDASLLEAFQS
ncbi:hypothetical protein N7495_004096 [Penicillium taxi]|uniref:uncharacterized protein n=1 Tax=Penicillium taxi TaxID=168475 RepID=UPI0025455968|nr:uncharacterized protein N7495_004096 [Penicillium taxi]KAJ5899352.1 hypothetical protein N7495_004096 [Penicillium taxi]